MAGVSLFGQKAEDTERLLAQPAVRWGDAAVWVFAACGLNYSESDAVFYAAKYKAMPASKTPDDGADLAGISLLIMRLYKLRGGLFYGFFPNRRYAFRELLYRGVLNYEDDPDDIVSGERFLQILSRAAVLAGGGG